MTLLSLIAVTYDREANLHQVEVLRDDTVLVNFTVHHHFEGYLRLLCSRKCV